ncbi:MAG: DUF2914 domain-containing protein [Longimonas sp.]|uniref:DUF2914 domain-containing protein n=1 Tax=Longimonas sp. TaxID=2039626 RepID=UPI003346C7C2
MNPSSAPAASNRWMRWSHYLERNRYYRWTRRLYTRYADIAPAVFFGGGVLWDVLTLRQIDHAVDNLILAAYIVLLGGCIVLAALRVVHRLPARPFLTTIEPFSNAGVQFFMGGLFSAYVVYFTRSASLTASAVFLVVLVAVLVANEFLWRDSINLYLMLGLYFLALFCFFTFFLPILVGSMSYGLFVAGGLLSMALVGGLALLLERWNVFESMQQVGGVAAVMLALFVGMNIAYTKNWIPPVPLSMQAGNIYHEVEVTSEGYALTYETPPWTRFWRRSSTPFAYAEGDRVYFFAAIFAPTTLQTDVVHRWQQRRETNEGIVWQTTDRIPYTVRGGRIEGFRGYTFKSNIQPGTWRVDVETEDGRTLGRVKFDVFAAPGGAERSFRTRIYE